jgi:hypothetical protein
MSIDLEAGGALVTAGLVASEIDGASADGKAAGHSPAICANCATPLTGAFCHGCGQKAHVHRSVLHLGEEFLHGLLHFDTKAWRTLPMLAFKPGELTRRYLDGQRTRFVSPLALFLFMMFLMFFVGSLTNGRGAHDKPSNMQAGLAELQAEAATARGAVAKAEEALRKAGAEGRDTADLKSDLDDAKDALLQAEKSVKVFDKTTRIVAAGDGKADADGDKLSDADMIGLKTDIAALDEAFAKANKNPELTKYKMKSAATKYTFLLVPLSMPFLWLMFFWKRGVTMYDHAVFVLYSLSFMALLFVLMFLVKFVGLKWSAAGFIMLAPPLHMFNQLKTTYSLGIGGALWRTFGLLLSAVIVFVLYLSIILVMTVR